jgi:beta-N-acetylhexosaminidase
MATTLREAVGSLIVAGLNATELTGLERAWLKLVRPAGIILFRRNIADARQTRALLAEAQTYCAPHAARFVDLEGGTVDRLRDALAPMPAAQSVARAAQSSGRLALAREHGELIARAVQAFGFNSTLAPVLDLALPESANVMGTRVAAPDAAGVAAYARDFLAGLAAHHVAGCGKHFPGLGGGTLDSHQLTPAIERNWWQLWNEDLQPYRTLRNQLPIAMVSHAAYPKTQGKKRPASVSSFWIEDVLRKQIGYRGLVLSDDLEMGGILSYCSIEEAAVEAIRAGTEIVEICHSPELILRAYEALLTEAEQSAAFRKLLVARARAAAKKRERTFRAALAPALGTKQFESLRARILRFAETVAKIEAAA